VEAVIFDPATATVSVYHPLVVDVGTQPLLPPLIPTLPNQAIVALFFGTNGLSLTLQPLTVMLQAECVNGISTTDIFGQFAYCHATAFYDAVNAVLLAGRTLSPPVPPLGKAVDGGDCPTSRSFLLVDQDPSDNLVVTYLLDPVTQRVLSDTPANRLQYPNAVILKNGSDQRLLTVLDAALGCRGYMIPVLNDPTGIYHLASLATNEIHAARVQPNPVALIPKGDPMARVVMATGSIPSLVKINAYRRGVNQPVAESVEQASTAFFCVHMLEQLGRLQENKALLTTQLSPDPAANTLFTFLANRFFQSYGNLRCDVILDVVNPVTVTLQQGVAVDAVFTIVDPIRLPMMDPYHLVEPTPSPSMIPSVTPSVTPSATPKPTTPITPSATPKPTTPITPSETPTTPDVLDPTMAPSMTQNTQGLSFTTVLYIAAGSLFVIGLCGYKIIPYWRTRHEPVPADSSYVHIPIVTGDPSSPRDLIQEQASGQERQERQERQEQRGRGQSPSRQSPSRQSPSRQRRVKSIQLPRLDQKHSV
jgi:hypothetical protein